SRNCAEIGFLFTILLRFEIKVESVISSAVIGQVEESKSDRFSKGDVVDIQSEYRAAASSFEQTSIQNGYPCKIKIGALERPETA
ncbi:hypothetical protein P6709_20035, partial [Jeotgalibacillus sp. ET6]|uniref:hypothetical protein n=1 Tax=Jeotgalibacillus sp. ET6 TaxID=3037260 RepID=UPI002418A70E